MQYVPSLSSVASGRSRGPTILLGDRMAAVGGGCLYSAPVVLGAKAPLVSGERKGDVRARDLSSWTSLRDKHEAIGIVKVHRRESPSTPTELVPWVVLFVQREAQGAGSLGFCGLFAF